MQRTCGRLRLPLAFALGITTGAATALECGPTTRTGVRVATGDGLYIKFRTVPTPLPMGELFALDAKACTPEHRPVDGRLEADALMPAHGHGMAYRVEPVITKDGAARLEGFLWQMPGLWQLRFRLETDAGPLRAVHDYTFTPG